MRMLKGDQGGVVYEGVDLYDRRPTSTNWSVIICHMNMRKHTLNNRALRSEEAASSTGTLGLGWN